MKKPGYIFVDDGYPEASDYNSNYICYNPEVTESYEWAVEEAKRRCSNATTPASRMKVRSRYFSAEVTSREISRSPAVSVKQERQCGLLARILNALKRLSARWSRSGGASGSKACDMELFQATLLHENN